MEVVTQFDGSYLMCPARHYERTMRLQMDDLLSRCTETNGGDDQQSDPPYPVSVSWSVQVVCFHIRCCIIPQYVSG
jgi:hypothetical protein